MTQLEGYPFTAIVGQEQMKLALILNVIDPQLGGVLIRGEKGTAKSTAVRALAHLMPARQQVQNCPYSCDPTNEDTMCEACRQNSDRTSIEGHMRVVDLPVGATEDRLVGTLDIEQALRTGKKQFEPGILAQANRNILYVDEVNLLEDHLVDLLLDAAAMGVNTVEREGVSHSHPAHFALVGTMNPEEGELRPQLLDRFGLVVDVLGEHDLESRVEVVRRRLAYEADPQAFARQYTVSQQQLAGRIAAARCRLSKVQCPQELLLAAARVSLALGVEGHRADIGMIRAAQALAAWEGKDRPDIVHLQQAAQFVLPHRMRRDPFEQGVLPASQIAETVCQALDQK